MTSKRSKLRPPALSSSSTEETHSDTSATNNISLSAILPTVDSPSDRSILIPPKKPKAECPMTASSSSHTHYFRRKLYEIDEFEMINSDQYVGVTESLSGSSDTFGCVHGPKGKRYTKKGLLKRNLLKLDTVKIDPQWTSTCILPSDLDTVKTLTYLVQQPKDVQYPDRMRENFKRFIELFSDGYSVHVIDNLLIISEFLLDNADKTPNYMKELIGVLKNMSKPIRILVASDAVKNMDKIRNFIAYLGYLTMAFADDSMFDLVSNALLFQLSAPDSERGASFRRSQMLAGAKKVLVDTIIRGISVSSPHRFQTFIQAALILSCESVDNCIDFMRDNILENVFYRFNPYFPRRDLPAYDINPVEPTRDINVTFGESCVNISTVLSLLLVLLKTTKEYIEKNPDSRIEFPPPCAYAQRCFVWVYRYNCRAHHCHHERLTLTVITNVMIIVYRDQLEVFGAILMPDVMALSVRTEVYPIRNNWTRRVNFGTKFGDAELKRLLIRLSVDFLSIFPYNRSMVKTEGWMIGLMYLVDPGLSTTRAKWSQAIYAEIRKTALQAFIISMRIIPQDLPTELSLIRRLMWYVEWYSQSPYELSILYWVVRVLQMSLFHKKSPAQKPAILQLFRTHGIIVLMNLCNTLMDCKYPPLEISQSVLGIVLSLIRTAVNLDIPGGVTCVVYPSVRWPSSINKLLRKMINLVCTALEKSYNISDRWMISMLNLIWEGIVWKKPYRDKFLEHNGVYKLLDIITMTRRPVQCLALALICDIVRAGDAVAQLVTWRASYAASNTYPLTVKRGSSIATLLTKICARDIVAQNIHLDTNNVIQDLDFPLMSTDLKTQIFAPEFAETKGSGHKSCLAAADLAGSTMSKCFAILQMLSEDLEQKVALADETYNLYKNVELHPDVESMLVLCSHFLSFKINTAWLEAQVQNHAYVPEDTEILDEFLHIGRGWAKNIQQQQLAVIEKYKTKEREKERTLYAFLRRVTLNKALDALTDVRCMCRSTDRNHITHTLIFEAVKGYHRRSVFSKKLGKIITTTSDPPLDDQNLIGQNIKMISIPLKHKPKKRFPEFEGSSRNSEGPGGGGGAGDSSAHRLQASDKAHTPSTHASLFGAEESMHVISGPDLRNQGSNTTQ